MTDDKAEDYQKIKGNLEIRGDLEIYGDLGDKNSYKW